MPKIPYKLIIAITTAIVLTGTAYILLTLSIKDSNSTKQVDLYIDDIHEGLVSIEDSEEGIYSILKDYYQINKSDISTILPFEDRSGKTYDITTKDGEKISIYLTNQEARFQTILEEYD